MRRRAIKALAGLVGAALLAVFGPVADAHASGFYDCPRGYYCGWTGESATGHMIKLTSDQPTLGSWDRRIRSWTNRSPYWVCQYVEQNYQFMGGVDTQQPNQGPGEGTGFTLGFSGQIRSIKFVRTERECQQPAWAPLYATARTVPENFGDMNGDGRADLLTRDLAGRLWLSNGADGSGKLLGTGWNSMTAITRHGDFTGDGHEDVIARDANGRLWLYPGSGSGALGPRVLIGTGWNVMRQLAAVGDFPGDGHDDLLALTDSGSLLLYPGTGHGRLGAPRLVRAAFPAATALVGMGDMNGDGHPDLVFRTANGRLWAAYGIGRGGISSPRLLSTGGWNAMTSLVGAGDVNGDGHVDLIAVGNIPYMGGNLLGVGRAYEVLGNGTLGGYQTLSEDWWGLNGLF